MKFTSRPTAVVLGLTLAAAALAGCSEVRVQVQQGRARPTSDVRLGHGLDAQRPATQVEPRAERRGSGCRQRGLFGARGGERAVQDSVPVDAAPVSLRGKDQLVQDAVEVHGGSAPHVRPMRDLST